MKTETQPGPFSRIPVELLEGIFEFCARDTLRSLCQVSKLFNFATIRLIYRDITLSSPSSVVRCAQSLASNPSAAVAVKALKISYCTLPGPVLCSFYRILAEAFHNLSQLLDLELLFHDFNILQILASCTFPRLRRFECFLPHSSTLASFLARHLDLNYLQLSAKDYLNPQYFTEIPPKVLLPKLEYLVGSSHCISALAHGAALRAACIEWTPVDSSMHECIAALQRSSSDSLRALSCRRAGWNLDLVDAISSAFPDILVLNITNVLVVDGPPYVATLETVGTYLTRFTSLRRLTFHSVDWWNSQHSPPLMDRDFICVRAWGMACPTLVECTLPHGLKWIRVRDHMWFPDPSEPIGTDWITDVIFSRRYPEMEQLIDIIEQILRERATVPGGGGSSEPTTLVDQSITQLRTRAQSLTLGHTLAIGGANAIEVDGSSNNGNGGDGSVDGAPGGNANGEI